MQEYNNLIKIIENKEVVSFDIFDTLLLRNVQRPSDIFRILDKYVFNRFGYKNFFDLRVESEQKSRCEANSYECNIDEIYEQMSFTSKENIENIKEKELELEEKFLVANPFMKKVYDYCIKNGKKIICISDMYLPEMFIRKVLEKNGYKIESVYVSNVYHKHKGNGSLFSEVAKLNSFDKSKWIHIGDNYYSDYEQPRILNISSYHYKNVLSRTKKQDPTVSISKSIINAIINNFVNNGLDIPYWEKFGALYAAPIYFGFASWIYNQCKDYDNIYFLARDGFMVKKAFDIICKNEKCKIDSRYLYVSRRAIQLPSLYLEEKKYIVDTLTAVNSGLNEKVKVNNVFKYFDLDPNNYKEDLSRYGFQIGEEVSKEKLNDYKQFVADFYDSVLKDIMIDKTNLIRKYLSQEHFDKYNKIYVVDIGWRGSIQHSLSKITEKPILGYYLCTSCNVYDDIYYDTKGYLVNYGEPSYLFDVIENNLMMYEFLFSSPEGSLRSFKKSGKDIVPVTLLNDEYSNEISSLQESALEVINMFCTYYDFIDDLKPEDVILPYVDFINEKHFEDLKAFNLIKTNVGYAGDKNSYVPSFTKNEINSNFMDFVDTMKKSMWNETYIVSDLDDENDFNKYRKQINKKCIRKLALKALREKGFIYCIKKFIKKILKRD